MMQMSPNAGGVENGARDRLHLLQRVHPIFHQYLPTIQDVENGRFGSSFDADLADDVTILRSDFKSLPYKLRYVDLEQITSDAELKHITKAFDSVLRLFEESVLDGVTSEDIRSSEAEWTDDDEDYLTATRSNSARLFRILEEWKNDLSDHYCSVGWACFQFEELIEKFDHPEIGKSSKDLAILYKCILNPLFRRLVSDFGEADNLFQGVSALSVPTRQKRPTRLERLVLYDDQESSQPDKKSGYADELVKSLNDGFLGDIRALRSNFEANGLAETMTGKQVPRKIRIAVLDTGIDRKDKMIKAAMGRKIVETRSFVDDDCEDTYGHGTHVTRLLIAMAPSAEIYVAKITDNKHVDPEDMGRIAEAINYAVETWDVDIISMSFGFEIENPDIDDAIDDAFKADKLMFVAASNEGGNRGRSRLARSSSVICIHACDGKGNKGDMSPSPEKQTQNFTTLGVAVKSVWKGKTVYKSGTSFATPVAAAMTACVLEFANFKCDLTKRQRKKLYKREGMINVLGAMSIERDDYDYVQPEHLWDGKTESDIVGDIMRIVNK
ncbi:hypothetical protein CcaCcLH18_02113 [Colletotrichum camelliae]|nr:hypothetical protein CcaCcLH18_02113 [Colletotrichum camelliae]